MTDEAGASTDGREAMRQVWQSRRVPFVREALGARVVTLQAEVTRVLIEQTLLQRAGVIERVDALREVALATGPFKAIGARRLAEQPDLILVDRHCAEQACRIRGLERAQGLRRAPILVLDHVSSAHLRYLGAEIDADGVLDDTRPPGSVAAPGFGAALLESVARLGWPEPFARACEGVGVDVSARPWPATFRPVERDPHPASSAERGAAIMRFEANWSYLRSLTCERGSLAVVDADERRRAAIEEEWRRTSEREPLEGVGADDAVGLRFGTPEPCAMLLGVDPADETSLAVLHAIRKRERAEDRVALPIAIIAAESRPGQLRGLARGHGADAGLAEPDDLRQLVGTS